MNQMDDNTFYKSFEWFKIKLTVDKRDGHACRQCGSTDKVAPHHIVPRMYRNDVPWGIDQLSNLINLCRRHHKMADRMVEPSVKPTHDMRVEKYSGGVIMDVDMWALT